MQQKSDEGATKVKNLGVHHEEQEALGLARSVIVLRCHDPRWEDAFQREAELLGRHLEGLVSGVEHIGSTAVAGLIAKPILDVAVAFDDPRLVPEIERVLIGLGYEYRGDAGEQGGHVFVRGPDSSRTHHLHLVGAGSAQWRRYLAFRDALRADAGRRESYAALKQALAARYASDRAAYSNGKDEYVRRTLAEIGFTAW
jgi:GrpB-like predicted nucleotidyltransferase (UPF0157 family)